jgi:hypothetical protein
MQSVGLLVSTKNEERHLGGSLTGITPSETLGLEKSWVQTQWHAGEIPAGSLLMALTWGVRQQLVSCVCCCVPEKKDEEWHNDNVVFTFTN